MPKIPSYCRHHGKFARVKIDGRWIHLGLYNSEDSKAHYKRLVAGLLAVSPVTQQHDTVTVAEVLEAYRAWAERHYGDVPHGQYRNLLTTLRTMRQLYADLPADQFTPKRLKVVRQGFIQQGNARSTVNRYVRRVIAIFAWAAEEELVPGSLVHSLREVRPLEYGRCDLPESEPVTPVSEHDVDCTIRELTPVVADMVRLQLLTGARPAEVCSITPGQIDRSGDVWLYRPTQHKTRHRGHVRVVCIGPKAQDVLRPYLLRPTNVPCFSPAESLRQHLDEKHDRRTTPRTCGNSPDPERRQAALARVGDRYDTVSYRRAIHRASDRAGVPRWSPNQLRHAAATSVRQQFGLDAAQAVLGHRHARVTEIYGELNLAKAAEVARRLG